jgi:hypothetical protein
MRNCCGRAHGLDHFTETESMPLLLISVTRMTVYSIVRGTGSCTSPADADGCPLRTITRSLGFPVRNMRSNFELARSCRTLLTPHTLSPHARHRQCSSLDLGFLSTQVGHTSEPVFVVTPGGSCEPFPSKLSIFTSELCRGAGHCGRSPAVRVTLCILYRASWLEVLHLD